MKTVCCGALKQWVFSPYIACQIPIWMRSWKCWGFCHCRKKLYIYVCEYCKWRGREVKKNPRISRICEKGNIAYIKFISDCSRRERRPEERSEFGYFSKWRVFYPDALVRQERLLGSTSGALSQWGMARDHMDWWRPTGKVEEIICFFHQDVLRFIYAQDLQIMLYLLFNNEITWRVFKAITSG